MGLHTFSPMKEATLETENARLRGVLTQIGDMIEDAPMDTDAWALLKMIHEMQPISGLQGGSGVSKARTQLYTLPGGQMTDDPDAYIAAWHSLADVIIELTGGDAELIGYDPDFSFRSQSTHSTVYLPLWFVRQVAEYVAAGKK